jgi:hypothetical protein
MQTESILLFNHIHISQMEPQINAVADVISSSARKMMHSKHYEKTYRINHGSVVGALAQVLKLPTQASLSVDVNCQG